MQFRLACTKIPKDVLLLEIGPHALMRSPLRQNRSDLQYVATMKKGESAVETLSAAVADLWRKGAIFGWPASAAPSAGAHPERESTKACSCSSAPSGMSGEMHVQCICLSMRLGPASPSIPFAHVTGPAASEASKGWCKQDVC